MGKINLDNVRGGKTFSVQASADTHNGAVVGLGGLVAGEYNLYEQVTATPDNVYLVTTPEVDRTNKSASIDHVNKEGVAMRVHTLEKGDIFTVDVTEAQPNLSSASANDKVTVSAGAFAVVGDSEVAVATVIEKTKIGSDAREAVALRVL